MSILPRLSIATKLYAIFALLAIATVVLAIMAGVSARHHATLTHKFQEAFRGAQYVERLNGLIYAIRLESRGALMAPRCVAVSESYFISMSTASKTAEPMFLMV